MNPDWIMIYLIRNYIKNADTEELNHMYKKLSYIPYHRINNEIDFLLKNIVSKAGEDLKLLPDIEFYPAAK